MIVFIIERFEATNKVNKKKAIIDKENEQKRSQKINKAKQNKQNKETNKTTLPDHFQNTVAKPRQNVYP